MVTEYKYRLLDLIKRKAQSAGYEMIVLMDGKQRIYRMLLDGLGSSETGVAVLEMNFIDDDNMGLDGNVGILQFFVTFDCEIGRDKLSGLLDALNKINLATTFGAFAVYTDEWQLYYRYTQLIRADGEDIPDEVMRVLNWIMALTDRSYDNIMELAGGNY